MAEGEGVGKASDAAAEPPRASPTVFISYASHDAEIANSACQPALKGIVGRGVTASDPYEDKHWDPVKRRQKIKALYVKLRFTDLNETPIIPWEELQQLPLSRFKWSIYASGVALPEVIVEELDRRWMARKTQHEVAAPAGAGSDILSSHPCADQLTQELAILGRGDLSPTEKESSIRARRGKGRYRQDLR